MLRQRATYEELLKETMTHRLKILPERQRRTQQGILLDDVDDSLEARVLRDFDDFDLDNYDKKMIIMNENPQKGTQTDMFFNSSSSSSSGKSSDNSEIEQIKQLQEELSNVSSKPSSEAEQEPEQPEKQKSLLRRMLDSMFEEEEVSLPPSRRSSIASGRSSLSSSSNHPVRNKKSDTPPAFSSSSSSSSGSDNRRDSSRGSDERPVLLPVETQLTPPGVSPPLSIRSSRSNTIEYIPSSSSNRTVQYVSSGSSRRTSHVSISS